jgi:predicted DNA-binding protein
MSPDESRIVVRVPARLREALEALADQDGRPLANYVRFQLTKLCVQHPEGGSGEAISR